METTGGGRVMRLLTGKGNAESKLMIIGDLPTYYDSINGSIMEGEKYDLFKQVVRDVLDEDLESFYRTVVVKSYTKEEVSESMIKKWSPQLIEEIKSIKPTVILTLGASAHFAVTGSKGMSKVRGKVINTSIEDYSFKLVSTFASAYVHNNDKYLRAFAEDVNSAIRLSKSLSTQSTGMNKTTMIETKEQLQEVIEYIQTTGRVSFDFETTGLDTRSEDFRATILAMSFQQGSAYCLPLLHEESPFTPEETQSNLDLLREKVFHNPKIRKIAHNLKFDMHVAARYGIDNMCGRMDDTMIMHHLIDETILHGLKDLVDTYFKEFSGYENDLDGEKWDTIGLDKLIPYAGLDSDLTLRLCDLFEAELIRDMRLYTIYRNLSMPANLALWNAEHNGMPIDRELLTENIEEANELLAEQSDELMNHGSVRRFVHKRDIKLAREKLGELSEKLEGCTPKKDGNPSVREVNYREAIRDIKLNGLPSKPINFGSPKQLGDLLYSEEGFNYKMPKDKRGNRKPMTGKEVLEELHDETGFIEGLRVWRTISKMLSTYLRPILAKLDENDRIHTSFLIHGTTTGRLASRNPNLQNIPNISKLTNARAIRVVSMVKQVFVVPEGHTMVQYDFSQAELRIIASFAKEAVMLEAYANEEDIHSKTAARLVGITLEEFDRLDPADKKRHRTNAKAVNFGLIYGMSAAGLVDYAKNTYGLILTLEEAQDRRTAFFEMYPKLLDYHDKYIAKARKFGHVRTFYGRKRRLKEINSPDEFIKSLDERAAINSPIQGTAGEFTIFAIALLHHRLDPRVEIGNTVHDSIVMFIPDDLLEETNRLVKETMENLPHEQYFGKGMDDVTMGIDIEVTKDNWASLEPYEFPN